MIDEDSVATGEFEAVEVDDEGNPVIPTVDHEWFWTMERVVRDLHASNTFKVVSSESHRPAPDVVKEHLEVAGGLQVPTTIRSLYDIIDGYDLRWQYKAGDEWVDGGQIQLYGFGEVFGSWLGTLWDEAPEGASPEDVDFTWELRGFDGADADSAYMTVFHVPDVLPRYNLYWHSPHEKTYRLRIDFLEYLECLTETRGLCGWQYMVCDDADLEGDDEALERVRQCTTLMAELFPEVDLSRYAMSDNG